MHLLAATAQGVADGSEAVDLGQTPADIVVLSAADTELAALSAARRAAGSDAPSLRLANLLRLGHNLSVDLYVEGVIAHARLVVVRLLGGAGYWRYGVEQVAAVCRERGIGLALLPGDDTPDPELDALSTLEPAARMRLWGYLTHGGAANCANFLRYGTSLIGKGADWAEPVPLVRAGLYRPGVVTATLADIEASWVAGRATAALVFYRALVQAADLSPVDALISALEGQGLNPLPLFVHSLKDPVSAALVEDVLSAHPPTVILNALGFALSTPNAARAATPFDRAECPVIQVVFSGGGEDAWRDGTSGLSARDIAMNVALPEVDGRIFSRAVSFKEAGDPDPETECPLVRHRPVPDRIAFVARLARAWAELAATKPAERRIALVLANYPNRDGRLGNGVGLDTPAGTVNVLRALRDAGYDAGDIPDNGNALIARLLAGPTNAGVAGKVTAEDLPRPDYEAFFAALPQAVREAVNERWGPPERDPFFVAGEVDCGRFAIPVVRFGRIAVGIQPARGYNIDPAASYHDPALVPPHGYFAFYAWVRTAFGAHAVVHMGKHGNLEWLPGKALALSEACFPEAALGPLPHLYPFIVNDPGEGTQAKRRAAAVIIDHLTPPLTRAETYGPLADLELLVDEYYEAAGVDPRRLRVLGGQIIDLARTLGLDRDCGIGGADDEGVALSKLDNHLCEIKELQIRDGLHVFGTSPTNGQRTDLLVALARVPRGGGEGGDASLIRALGLDLGFGHGFDPLDCVMADPWPGPKPEALAAPSPWRTFGDTVERLEILARALVAGERAADPAWERACAVLDAVKDDIALRVDACGAAEIKGLLRGLDGRFVPPGSSGAPTRGRIDVLPTGRNFYSVDTRTVPTPAAWTLGWKSAGLLLERHRQEHGEWPRVMALSAWGTSNMRTGGDDIAQGLALMGVRPLWDTASRRVTGFEVLPPAVLDRPRVDVTLRISGFFRDAFPALIELFDAAARAVAALDEPPEINPLAARVRAECRTLIAEGSTPKDAALRAGHRVFGSKPGAYGAGLQALIDERGWESADDLARAYVAWGGYAYGAKADGRAEHDLFERRLGSVEAVVHNQDNREHDLLDSDDYYQFEGGMTAAVKSLSGTEPSVYHNDHSRPFAPRIRTLKEEIARIVRGRVVNPKWIEGVMRHGYKGGFEMAATVDYLFAFSATTGAVGDHHFDAVFEAYLVDEKVLSFLRDNNPDALTEMAARMQEALARGLWRPKSNSAHLRLSELAKGDGA